MANQEQEVSTRLVNANYIARKVGKSPEWVRRNVPGKIKLGYRSVVWYEHEVDQWIEDRRVGIVEGIQTQKRPAATGEASLCPTIIQLGD